MFEKTKACEAAALGALVWAPALLTWSLLVLFLMLLAGCPAPAASPTNCADVELTGGPNTWLYRCVFPDAVCYMTERGGVSCHFDPPDRRQAEPAAEVNGAY